MTDRLSRRKFVSLLGAGATIAAAPGFWTRSAAAVTPAAPASGDHGAPVCFFFVSDSHVLAVKDDPAKIDPRSMIANQRLIETLNRLPGTPIPESSGGGVVGIPRGVIHGGDLIDSADKNGPVYAAMQRSELKAYVDMFGLDGKDGKLRFPVYEIHGNHDGPGGTGIVIAAIIDRNKRRPGLASTSPNGLHCAWEWGPFHLVNLGIVVGAVPEVTRRRRYAPLASLDFLKSDLEKRVGNSGRPVILTHHVDILRYSGPADPDAPFSNKEWDPCDVAAYHKLISNYNVIAILYGHTHAWNIVKWDGHATKSASGIDLFNVTQSSHFHSENHGFFYFEFTDKQMTVRQYSTTDNWLTAEWSAAMKYPIAIPAKA